MKIKQKEAKLPRLLFCWILTSFEIHNFRVKFYTSTLSFILLFLKALGIQVLISIFSDVVNYVRPTYGN